jgi:F0F1-type ATP synthase assembly protein I
MTVCISYILTVRRGVDTMEGVKYVGKDGKIRSTGSPVKKKKYESKYGLFVMDVGLYIAIPLLMGVAAGLFLDGRFGTKPVFVLICIGLGAIASFYNLFRLVKKDDGSSSPHQHQG